MKKEEQEKEPINWKKEIISWIQILVAAAVIALVVNTFLIANSHVPSGSMENTIMTKDRVIGSRLTYKFQDPERGDIAIFLWPDNESINYVKRIIGLPGDVIDIRNGQVYLNNSETPLEEPYLKEPMHASADEHYEVPEDCYFMMGDNRNDSLDARVWDNTYVKRSKLLAKVYFKYYPKLSMLK